MNSKYLLKRIFLIIFLSFILYAPSYAQSVVKEAIQIKINLDVEKQFTQATFQRQSINQKPILNVGIQQLDALNTSYKVTNMRRVFPDAGEFEALHRQFGLHLWYELTIETTKKDIEEIASDYNDVPEIEIAQPVYEIRRIDAVPFLDSINTSFDIQQQTSVNDPEFSKQWHYNNTGQVGTAGVDIRLPDAWGRTMGATNVMVAVVDGGIDYQHNDIAGNMWSGIGRNFATSGSGVTADDHGTHVAGTIAAVSNNGIGVAGIAGGSGSGNGVRLISCQIFDGPNKVSAGPAIVYGADNGAVISQNSWGYTEEGVYNQSDLDAIRYFIANAGKKSDGTPREGTPMVGGIVIFAAGNDNSGGNRYPGAFPEVLSVASVGPNGKRAYYSNYGPWVDISAPGGDAQFDSRTVYSTLPNNGYGYKQGTSMACPHVSGVAALVLSFFGSESYTPTMLWERLLLSTNPLYQWNPDMAPYLGSGLIDATKALANYVAVTGVLLPETATILKRRTVQITPTIIPANASNQRVVWESSDESVAVVDMYGLVTGVNIGSAEIRIRTLDGNFRDTTQVEVVPVPVESVVISPKSLQIKLNDTRLLQAVIKPVDASNNDITWYSINPSIANINPLGVVSAISVGSTQIVVNTVDGNYQDTCYVDVLQPVTGVQVDKSSVCIVIGDTSKLSAIVYPSNAYNKKVIWESNNSSVASVDQYTGIVSGKSAGSAEITAKTEDGNYKDKCNVIVLQEPYVPQGFSPNGDGVNDTFEMILDRQETYSLRIFDKSGQIYYESSDYKNDWSGMANTGAMKGKKVLPGSYFYILAAKNGAIKKGYVVIRY